MFCVAHSLRNRTPVWKQWRDRAPHPDMVSSTWSLWVSDPPPTCPPCVSHNWFAPRFRWCVGSQLSLPGQWRLRRSTVRCEHHLDWYLDGRIRMNWKNWILTFISSILTVVSLRGRPYLYESRNKPTIGGEHRPRGVEPGPSGVATRVFHHNKLPSFPRKGQPFQGYNCRCVMTSLY